MVGPIPEQNIVSYRHYSNMYYIMFITCYYVGGGGDGGGGKLGDDAVKPETTV